MKTLIIFSLVFRFIFIPFIQREVDAWVYQRNWTKRRSDRKKVLPNGIPMIILQKPHKWKAADYKVYYPYIILHHLTYVTRLLFPQKLLMRSRKSMLLQMTLFLT